MTDNDGFEMVDVASTQIAAMGFKPETQQIKAVFVSNGAVYVYENCDQELLDNIVNAPSVGSAFNALLKYAKPYSRIS